MADTHGNPSRSIARASRADVSVTQQGDKMHDNNNNNDTRTNAYIEVIHFKTMPADGDGITYGRIHVQIAVWADEDMNRFNRRC